MNKRLSGVTLVELIVAVILLSVIILAVVSIDTFGRYHLIGSDHRSQLQNKLAYTLEHMQKNITMAAGSLSFPPIRSITNGFSVRVDPHILKPAVYPIVLSNTPFNAAAYPMYTLVSYTLASTTIDPKGVPDAIHYSYTLPNGTSYSEDLATNIAPGVVVGVMPSNPTINQGFFINITDPGTGTPVGGAAVEIGLVGRWDPTIAASNDNPQVAMKTKVYATSASAK